MKDRILIIISFFLFLLFLSHQLLPSNFEIKPVIAVTGQGKFTLPNVTGALSFPGGVWDQAGNLGIGTGAPGAKFDIAGVTSSVIAPNAPFTIGTTANGPINFKMNNSNQIFFTATGQIGIGISNPTAKLQLSTDSAAKPTTEHWTVISDVRLKENIAPFTDGLSIIGKINPVSYQLNGKAGTPKGDKGIGLIAQEVKDFLPYSISTFKAKLNPEDIEETELYNLNSSALEYVSINAIKELAQKTTTGKATLPSGQKDITINNDMVLEKSLIFLTPTSSTQNRVLYISGQSPGYFTVSLDTSISTPINFNWMISN